MKYSQYYRIKESQLNLRDISLFREMSLKLDAPDYSDLTDNFFKPDYVNAHLDRAKLLDTVNLTSGQFKVYSWFSYLLFISKENFLAARIEFEKKHDGIQMTSIEVARPFKGLMKSIFLEYLLPEYNTIESDTVQTVNAFLFYKKLAIESITNKNFKMYIKYNKTLEEITDCSQMDKTYGEHPSKGQYTYIVKK